MTLQSGLIPESKEELLSILRENVVDVVFTKVDGSERKMRCTLMPSYLPEKDGDRSRENWTTDAVPVWDLDISDWRAFRLSSIKDIRLAIDLYTDV